MLIGIIDYDDNKNIKEEEVRNIHVHLCVSTSHNEYFRWLFEGEINRIHREKKKKMKRVPERKKEKELNAHNRFSTKTELKYRE